MSEREGSIPRVVSGERAAAKSRLFTADTIATGLTAAAVLAGVVLRWLHLGRLSLWWDEGLTVWVSGLSAVNVVRFGRITAPPLYYLLQHFWVGLFGNSESAVRALSALFGTLSLPVFYFLAKKILNDSMAVTVAVWVFAFSFMQIQYSQDARFYGMLSFLALASLYALVLFLQRQSVALFVTIVLCLAATLYTHNMASFYLLALNVTWLIYPSERALMQRVKEVLLCDILVGVLYLPWIPSLLSQVGAVHESFWAPKPTVSNLLQTWSVIAGFQLDYLAEVAARLLPLSLHTARACVLGVVSLLCAALLVGGLWRVAKADRNRNVSLLFYCLLPILVIFLLSRMVSSVYINRIFIGSSVVVPIIFAYPLAAQKGRKGRMFYGLLGIALAAATALSSFAWLQYRETENWRGATNSLLRIQEKNRLMVFIPGFAETLFDYYAQRSPDMGAGVAKMGLPRSYPLGDLELPGPAVVGPALTTDLTALKLAVESKKYSEIDLVLSHDEPGDELVSDYLSQVLVRLEEQRFTRGDRRPGIGIVRFVAPPR